MLLFLIAFLFYDSFQLNFFKNIFYTKTFEYICQHDIPFLRIKECL